MTSPCLNSCRRWSLGGLIIVSNSSYVMKLLELSKQRNLVMSWAYLYDPAPFVDPKCQPRLMNRRSSLVALRMDRGLGTAPWTLPAWSTSRRLPCALPCNLPSQNFLGSRRLFILVAVFSRMLSRQGSFSHIVGVGRISNIDPLQALVKL